MTNADWIVLVGSLAALMVPSVGAWIWIATKLRTSATQEDIFSLRHCITELTQTVRIAEVRHESQERQWQDTQKELREIWRCHNHQEGRIYTQDRAIGALLAQCNVNVDDTGWAPKEKPNYRGPNDE